MIDIFAVKDLVLDKIEEVSDILDLEERVSSAKKTLVKAKKDLSRKVSNLKEKNVGDILNALCPRKNTCEKRGNPIVTVFCILGGIILAFAILVAAFYGIFSLLDCKKKNGYHTLKF